MSAPSIVSHAVGYYIQPSSWIGDSVPDTMPDLDIRKLAEVAHEATAQGVLKCKAFRDGLFTFDFSQCPDRYLPKGAEKEGIDRDARYRAQQTAVLNCHLMCLYTALCQPGIVRVVPRMIVDPSTLVLVNESGEPQGFKSDAITQLALARYPLTYHPGLPRHMDWRNLRRQSYLIKSAEVEQAFALFDQILGRPTATRLISLADLLARAVKAVSELNYEIGLGLSWMVCEACLDQAWDRYLDERATEQIDGVEIQVVNGKRREKLTGRDYSASVITEILSLAGKLSFADYKDLNEVRSARNRWIHDLDAVARSPADKALQLAQRMLRDVEGVGFTVGPSMFL